MGVSLGILPQPQQEAQSPVAPKADMGNARWSVARAHLQPPKARIKVVIGSTNQLSSPTIVGWRWLGPASTLKVSDTWTNKARY